MIENPYGLRGATPADAETLMPFVMNILSEEAPQTPSPEKVSALIDRCLNRDRAIAGMIVGPEGAIHGSVGATIETFDYSDEPHVMIKWMGVADAYKKSDLPARMMGYMKWLYDTFGQMTERPMPVFLAALTTTDLQRKVLMFQRRAPQVGMLFAYGCRPDRTFLTPARVGAGRIVAARQHQEPASGRIAEPVARPA